MPTLLENGKIVKEKYMSRETHRDIDNMRGIDFFIKYIGDRMWDRDIPPKEKLRGIGSKVIVLRSGTGSGKSTLLPPFLYKHYLLEQGGNLIITQPTRSTATDIPYQILQYNPVAMGESIGYQTGSVSWKPRKGILFSTVGILLQFLKIMDDDDFMRKYKFIIIDEVHARQTELDSCLYYIKRLLQRQWNNPQCPLVILTSATFEPKIFMDYFHIPRNNFLDVLGATFPREVNMAPFDLSNFQQYAIDLTEKIHVDHIDDITKHEEFRDILIFVSGGKQIREISDAIHMLNANVFSRGLEESKTHSKEQWAKYIKGGSASDKYYIAPIAVMSANIQKGGKEYMDLFSPIETVTVPIYKFDSDGKRTDEIINNVPASRRVMIGSNAIETGMTIDTLGYCIDTGWVNESSFNPNFGCTLLVNKNVTQANSEQRKGRIGRKAPGKFYAAYTDKSLKVMPELPFPEIVKSDVTSFILDTVIAETKSEIVQIDINERTINSFQMNQFDQNWYELKHEKPFIASSVDLIQYPSSDSIQYSLEVLHGLGFISYDYYPTIFGMYASKFRKLPLAAIRMILASYHTGANTLDIITIACCLQEGSSIGINKRKYQPRDPLGVGKDEASEYFKLLFCDEFIEFIFIWHDFMRAVEALGDDMEKSSRLDRKTKIAPNYLPKWAHDNNLNYEALLRIIELRDEIIMDMLNMGLNPYYNGLDLPRGTYNLVKILKRNITEGVEEIRKIKKCIYEGYRFNLCTWNQVSKSYVNNHYHNNIVVESAIIKPMFKESAIDPEIKQFSPQKIIVHNVMIRPSFKAKGMFEFSGDYISVMDGYVDVDTSFLVS